MTTTKPQSYAKYIPERDYRANDYKAFGKPKDFDLCGSCMSYYKKLHAHGLAKSPNPPQCNKHVLTPIKSLKRSDFDSDDDFLSIQIALDPVSWAKAELNWDPRWYQEEMLSCTSSKKLYRCGRRLGKTVCMVIECLHYIATHDNQQVLIIAPYEAQVTMIFDEMKKWMNQSVTLKNSVCRDTKSPNHRLEFKNGSRVLGFSSGASSASRSDKIRGQDAHLIIIDEIDYLAEDDLDAIMAIMASHPDCRFIAASTPQGWRKKFYAYATNKNLGFKEFWYISAEAPTWSKEQEYHFKESYSDTSYQHEFNAEFADTEGGVFRRASIDSAIEYYDMEDLAPEPGRIYVLGVDWNKSAGTHMTIIEWVGGKMRLAKKIIIPESEYIQTDSVQRIIDLNNLWSFTYIFVDAGYGTTQVEMLKKHGIMNPSTGLHRKVHAFHMNQSIEIKDPISGKPVKKPAKQFLIQQTAKLLEDGVLILPETEDTSVTGDKNMGLVQQMRNFRVESYSILGLPRYSQGQDHTVVAYTLACSGLVLEGSDLKNPIFNSRVAIAPVFGEDEEMMKERAKEQQEQVIKTIQDIPRSYERRSLYGFSMGSIAREQQEKVKFRKSLAKEGTSVKKSMATLNTYMKRTNIGSFKRKNF